MKLTRKTTTVLSMTSDEMDAFMDNVAKAREGHTSHYAESKLNNGTYLGVQLDEDANKPTPAEQERAYMAQKRREQKNNTNY